MVFSNSSLDSKPRQFCAVDSNCWQHVPRRLRPITCAVNLDPSELMKARSINVHCVANLCFPGSVYFVTSSYVFSVCAFTQTCVWITKIVATLMIKLFPRLLHPLISCLKNSYVLSVPRLSVPPCLPLISAGNTKLGEKFPPLSHNPLPYGGCAEN